MVGFFCKNAEKEIPILIWIESAGNDDIGSRWKAKPLAYLKAYKIVEFYEMQIYMCDEIGFYADIS